MTGHHPLLGANRHAPLHLTPTESYRAHSPVHDEIRTIFISGFPHNILSRELNNLLRFLPGYEASQLCFKDGKPHGFAMFTTHAMALAAISQLSNVVFDNSEVYPSILRAEIARSNIACLESSPKQTKLNSASSSAIQQPNYKHYAPQQPASYSTLQYQTPTKTASDYHPYFTTSNTQSRAPSLSPPPPSSVSHSQRQYKSVTNDNDNAPCNTLFVGKMGDTVQESELLELFSNEPGFKQLKLLHSSKGASCFIEFIDVPSAAQCQKRHQGAVLSSSSKGAIRIQFSKNPFGHKRDANGNIVPA